MARRLNFKDYLKALKLISATPELKERFDKDKDGFLDPDELEKGAAIYGREIRPKSETHKPRTRKSAPGKSQGKAERKKGYIAGSLLGGEKIIYQTRMHKIIFIRPSIWLLICIGLLFSPFEYSKIASLGFLIIGAVHWLTAYIQYVYSEFGLTSQRVIVKEGFLHTDSLELFLKKIESIQVHQSFMGRALNYGTIHISGTGGKCDPLETICRPLEFKQHVQKAMVNI